MDGPGLVKSLKRVWRVKSDVGVLGISVLTSSTSTLVLKLAPMLSELAQTTLTVTGDSPGGLLEMKMFLEVEEGEIVLQNVEREITNEGEFNPFVSGDWLHGQRFASSGIGTSIA